MSDSVMIIAMMCIAMLGTVAIVMMSTYLKDKVAFGVKVKVKDIESAMAVDATDKESKNKRTLSQEALHYEKKFKTQINLKTNNGFLVIIISQIKNKHFYIKIRKEVIIIEDNEHLFYKKLSTRIGWLFNITLVLGCYGIFNCITKRHLMFLATYISLIAVDIGVLSLNNYLKKLL